MSVATDALQKLVEAESGELRDGETITSFSLRQLKRENLSVALNAVRAAERKAGIAPQSTRCRCGHAKDDHLNGRDVCEHFCMCVGYALPPR